MEINGNNIRINNFGNRVDGPWVFRMAEQGSRKVKMFLVEKRDRDTLLPLLLKHVDTQSVIVSDGWKAYCGLILYFCGHNVVNHSENFIDPTTGCHTQLIECIWSHAKLKIMANKRGTIISLLQSHLSFFCFCYRFKGSKFEVFMRLLGGEH
ncbi:hypothetical protein HERIO_1597 [Hepatospora eriocheir]|uniref:ISXO2-like transposase domain-containing protein n=1 Tax=Hepatospora eriocheir TaxID=1081669 RepID=A0A1X0Q9N1_9MICR|nr:hypothetical protein HERIO_1597 [Hepatospora eriocheir]